MNRALSILAAALCLAANMGAATVPNHQQPQAKTDAIPMAVKTPKKSTKAEQKPYQVGSASWYGKQFHGKTTASGEDFDMSSSSRPLTVPFPFGDLCEGNQSEERQVDCGSRQ